MLSRRFRIGLSTFLGALLLVGTQAVPAYADTEVTTPFKVNFGPSGTPAVAGYVLDTGLGYDAVRGYGWTNTTDAPLNVSSSARDRNLVADQRLDTFIHMQLSPTPEAKWKAAIANGTYLITAAVGDAQSINSHHVIHAEGTTVADFTPTAATKFAIQSAEVEVTDGFLNIDANGGTNTKLAYLDIVEVDPSVPHATGVDPASGAFGVSLSASMTVQLSEPVDSSTLDAGLQILDNTNTPITGHRNTDGANSNATFVPTTQLMPNSQYTIQITPDLKTEVGNLSYEPFTSTFTTGTTGAATVDVSFTRQVLDMQSGATVMTMGPDGSLWVGTVLGEIFKYSLDANGLMTGKVEYSSFEGTRTITGLRIDPTDATVLWVSHAENVDCIPNCVNFTGKISTLSGSNFGTARDVVTGLPRAVKDHMNNGIDFGPDGKLYLGQGSMNGFGAYDNVWKAVETPLNATILQMDVHGDSRFAGPTAINVNTASPNSYNPDASNAPVKIWTEGIRNPFSILWASNNKLYSVVNESANGNAPAGGGAPALNNLPSYNDYFTQVVPNKYYGHPNPSRNLFILNGGNPTAGVDPFEVTQYPVGQMPNTNWRKPDLDLGLHRSSNGMVEFESDIFGGALKGDILATEYSQGDDIYAVQLNAAGDAVSKKVVATGLYNPLGLTADAVSGRVYVGEYGQDPTGVGGQISVLVPDAQPSDPTVIKKVNFQSQTTTTPSGYSADFGQAFDTTRGYGWVNESTGAALDLTGNGRERNVNPDKRLDTFMHMVLPASAPGVHTPGKWELTIPNGTYNVKVAVGDPNAPYNSSHVIRAEGTTIIPAFVATAAETHKIESGQVSVSDGRLTIDSIGGTNTKINYVEVRVADTVAPEVTAAPSGTTNGSGEFEGSATFTINASDSGSGVASVSYTLDGGSPTPYTAPFTVTGEGEHTVVVTATDNAGNATKPPVSSTFTIVQAAAFNKKINFGPVGGPTIAGYTNDTGEAFDTGRGWGWENQTTGAPLSLVGNGRDRNLVSDQRKDTLMMFQATSGITTPGKWEIVVPNGNYNLTLGIGDPGFNNSVYKINAEGAQIVNFTPTAALKHNTFNATATVNDGRLTIDGIGSTNAKIQFIDIAQVVGGPTPPSVSIDVAGTQDASNNYVNQATVTINATDTDGVASVSYTLDGGSPTPYTAPFAVSSVGSHTVVATATDTGGATSSPVTTTFSVVAGAFNAAKINFSLAGGPTIAGYTNDIGDAFTVARGYGWETEGAGTPLSLLGNGRDRNLVTDQRQDTLMQFQASGGVTTRGQWEYVLPNGTYDVTLSVGDAGFINSTHRINIEGVNVVNNFVPTNATKFQTVTTSVTVADGRLTLDGVGGTNTKINYIDIIKPGADLTPPVVTVNTSGTTDASGSYVGQATVTINATDGGSGVASRSYSLDGGPATNYTAPFNVSALGTHTVVATATDNATNTSAPVTKTFDVVSGSGGTPSALEVITPHEFLGLGDRAVFSTVKNEVRPGIVIQLKNNGGSVLNVTNLTFSGAQAGDFKLPTGAPTSYTINPGQTVDVTVNYRPNVGRQANSSGSPNAEFVAPYTTNSYISKGALNIASNDPGAPTYQVTLGGLNAENYEGRTEPDLQEIVNAIGFKTTVGVTDWPRELGIGSQSSAAGEEVISAFWKKLNTAQPVGMFPIAHYSGKSASGANSTTFGWYPKGAGLNTMYAFPGMNATADVYGNGYGENQLMFPRTTSNSGSTSITTNRTFNPSGSFGLFDGQGNRSLDTSNTGGFENGNWHNFRFWPAKDAGGNVIPGVYIVGDDIGVPQRNGAKNWDYQDYAFLLTNVQPDGGSDQPVDPAPQPSLPTLEFNGDQGGIATTGFLRSEGSQNLAQVSVTGGQLRVLTNSDSNTSHTNMLNVPFNAGTDFQVESRLVGPFDAINAGAEQQAIYFGHDATHYLKVEVENVSGVRKLTIYRQNGTGSGAGVVAGQVNLPGGNANTLDLRIQVVPSEFSIKDSAGVTVRHVVPYAKVSYRVNSSDAGAWQTLTPTASASCTVAPAIPPSNPTNCLAKDENNVNQVLIPDNWIRSKTYAGIITSHQGSGGSQFTAVYENFKVQRWFR